MGFTYCMNIFWQNVNKVYRFIIKQTSDCPIEAITLIEGHSDEYHTSGIVKFTQNRYQIVEIEGEISGLTPNSLHGFHIHQKGDITGGCGSTGGHFNPYEETHGSTDSHHRHVGDLGNIEADENGVAKFSFE